MRIAGPAFLVRFGLVAPLDTYLDRRNGGWAIKFNRLFQI